MPRWESPIERMLYYAMLDYGLLPTLQYEIGKYRVDFAFLEEKLIVEADGKAYHSSKRAKYRDARRERCLKVRGWKIMRFTGSQIWNDAKGCAKLVRKEIRR